MTTKQWLSRARKCDEEIETLRKAVEKERDRVLSITATLGGDVVSGSADQHKLDNYAALVDELESRVAELYKIKKDVKAVVDGVQDETLRQILILRYVSVTSWEEIAVAMHFSYRHVCRLHGDALAAVKDLVREKMS